MQKVEVQHSQQSQPAVRQGQGAALASPQGEQIAQLEALVENSPQTGWLAQLAAATNNSPHMDAQRKAINAIYNSPGMAAQRQQLDSSFSGVVQRKAITTNELPGTEEEGAGQIFDSKIAAGKLFKAKESVDRANWDSVIAKYQETIRPLGNAVQNTSFTDMKLVFNLGLPAENKWGQKKGGFINGAKTTLHMDDSVTAVTHPNRDFWKTLTDAAAGDRNTLRNRNDIGLIDPFLVSVVVEDSSGKSAADWSFATQFADSGSGYIKQILYGKLNLGGNIRTAQDFAAEKDTNTPDDRAYVYSSTHEQGEESFASRISGIKSGNDTLGGNAKGLDAVTWLAAEGARFEPVAALGGKGSPKSHYFIKPNATDWVGYKYYTAIQLMQSWKVNFGKKYGVTAEDMERVVATSGKDDVAEPPSGWHYNLTDEQEYQKQ